MKVYCCFSLYNLYIAVAKAMVQNEKIDLVIGSQMPDYKNKIETIKSLDFINDIYVKQHCPMFHIPNISLYTFLHL